ncbi:HAD family hydrolase [Wenzhouxiangella sp. XN201]|uniref:HAD family hydrolase n=1 Tax=Wenzhouxiangella sp. XN201 TaxID=2710755 RepID=UPI0013C733EB|nr:HAD family hydrolase [Wenzhouxiangella sp. XN201]NEZ04983.1 HAD family hydrolase [Wenzhouxiangella sp. XN201]
MHVVCFDIDGTLVASAGFDGELYAEAIRDVLGVEIDTDWSQYENVTDSGILEEILEKHSSPDQRGRMAQQVHTSFVGLTKRYVAENPSLIREIPGALALVGELRKSPEVRVCVATGGWAETAALKLRAIGLEPNDLAMATGSDALRRTDIMRLAESRATQGVVAKRRTYFGDGVWDQRAASQLGYDFVAVGGGVNHHLAFPDLQDLESILSQLGV